MFPFTGLTNEQLEKVCKTLNEQRLKLEKDKKEQLEKEKLKKYIKEHPPKSISDMISYGRIYTHLYN